MNELVRIPEWLHGADGREITVHYPLDAIGEKYRPEEALLTIDLKSGEVGTAEVQFVSDKRNTSIGNQADYCQTFLNQLEVDRIADDGDGRLFLFFHHDRK